MIDSDLQRLASEGRERAELAVKLAATVEAEARAWMRRVESQPPKSEQERVQFREKVADFRHLETQRLDDLANACRAIAELVSRLGDVDGDAQVIIIRTQIASVLDGEAATARALAFVLEVCAAIDRVT